MGLFGWFRKKEDDQGVSKEEKDHADRKCKLVVSAYQKCKLANRDQLHACDKLKQSVVICYGAELIKGEPMASLQHCMNSLSTTGLYRGKNNCDEELRDVNEALKRMKAYPFEDDAPVRR